MSKFQLQFSLDNDTFDDEFGMRSQAVASMLREAAEIVLDGGTVGRLRDPNGNRVGFWSIEED